MGHRDFAPEGYDRIAAQVRQAEKICEDLGIEGGTNVPQLEGALEGIRALLRQGLVNGNDLPERVRTHLKLSDITATMDALGIDPLDYFSNTERN